MAMIAGDARDGTGLAGAMAAKMKAQLEGFDLEKAWPGINAQAEAIVEYLVAEASVSVTGVQVGAGVASGTIS